MRVMLKRPWSAPGGVFYEPRSYGIELPDDLKDFLPSDAEIVAAKDEARVDDPGNWPSPSGKNPPAVQLPPSKGIVGETFALAPQKAAPEPKGGKASVDRVLVAEGELKGQAVSRQQAEDQGLETAARPGEPVHQGNRRSLDQALNRQPNSPATPVSPKPSTGLAGEPAAMRPSIPPKPPGPAPLLKK